MHLQFHREIAAPRDLLFTALQDPDVLRNCIPGCESLEPENGHYAVALLLGLPGVRGRYAGRVTVKNVVSPASLVLEAEGKGGPGFVAGSARVRLEPVSNGTSISCEAEFRVGGAIASVGARIVAPMAKRMMDEFFTCIALQLEQG